MRFREHRGSLADSIKTLVELQDRTDLLRHCRRLLDPWHYRFYEDQFHVEHYCGRDTRLDPSWEDTHIVTIDGYGVMGFTDGPC